MFCPLLVDAVGSMVDLSILVSLNSLHVDPLNELLPWVSKLNAISMQDELVRVGHTQISKTVAAVISMLAFYTLLQDPIAYEVLSSRAHLVFSCPKFYPERQTYVA